MEQEQRASNFPLLELGTLEVLIRTFVVAATSEGKLA